MALPTVLQNVLDRLHAGYPKGIPQQDYYPLLAFLVRRLTTDEVIEVVSALPAEQHYQPQQPTSDEVRAAVETLTSSPVREGEIRRIEEHFRNLGWELERGTNAASQCETTTSKPLMTCRYGCGPESG
jgi:hypothetical protein